MSSSGRTSVAPAQRPPIAVWNPVRDVWEGGADRPVLRALGRVVGDLAGLGYDATWESLRASAVGAPHRRERVFVLAWRPDAADTLRILRDRPRGARGRRHEPTDSRRGPGRSPWLEYAPAIRRWEEVTGREAPPPTETGQRGRGATRHGPPSPGVCKPVP